jgi:hypothetical protein
MNESPKRATGRCKGREQDRKQRHIVSSSKTNRNKANAPTATDSQLVDMGQRTSRFNSNLDYCHFDASSVGEAGVIQPAPIKEFNGAVGTRGLCQSRNSVNVLRLPSLPGTLLCGCHSRIIVPLRNSKSFKYGSLWWQISLCRGPEKLTMPESEVQIGNSG